LSNCLTTVKITPLSSVLNALILKIELKKSPLINSTFFRTRNRFFSNHINQKNRKTERYFFTRN
ncbi:TPA: hypothetical protein ACRVFM_002437, partial [Staphylococcus aureus]